MLVFHHVIFLSIFDQFSSFFALIFRLRSPFIDVITVREENKQTSNDVSTAPMPVPTSINSLARSAELALTTTRPQQMDSAFITTSGRSVAPRIYLVPRPQAADAIIPVAGRHYQAPASSAAGASAPPQQQRRTVAAAATTTTATKTSTAY